MPSYKLKGLFKVQSFAGTLFKFLKRLHINRRIRGLLSSVILDEVSKLLLAYVSQAERAEQWLHRVYSEIEKRFLQQSDARLNAPQQAAR